MILIVVACLLGLISNMSTITYSAIITALRSMTPLGLYDQIKTVIFEYRLWA